MLVSPVLAQPPLFFPPQTPIQTTPMMPSPMRPPPGQAMPYMPQLAYPQMPQYGYPNQMMQPQAMPRTMPQRIPQQNARPQKPFKEFSGYLGLITDIVPSSVIAQLPKGVTQGVLFKGFSENSPASNSDLKPYDVMFFYDQKILNHPAQLIKLIRNDKPGRVVKLKVVRKGSIQEVAVTIGSQKTPNPKDFNGLEIKQYGDDKFRAIIHFLGPNGNKQLRSFQGTREDIFDEARNNTDLPPAERQQLLHAMRPRNGSNTGFGSFLPFGNNGSKDWKFMDPGKYFKW